MNILLEVVLLALCSMICNTSSTSVLLGVLIEAMVFTAMVNKLVTPEKRPVCVPYNTARNLSV